jgi:hypothetical protein
VVARSEVWSCGRTLAGVAGLNAALCMDVCVVCCTVKTVTSQDIQNKEISTVKIQRNNNRKNRGN